MQKLLFLKTCLSISMNNTRFCTRNKSSFKVMTCPTGSYCLEIAQWEFTDDFKMCGIHAECEKRDDNTTTCHGPGFEKPCTPSNSKST